MQGKGCGLGGSPNVRIARAGKAREWLAGAVHEGLHIWPMALPDRATL